MTVEKRTSGRELELLVALADGADRIGARIRAECSTMNGGKTMPFGTLYTVLKGMEERGWLTGRADMEHGRQVRIYRITDQGIRALTEARDFHNRLSQLAAEGLAARKAAN